MHTEFCELNLEGLEAVSGGLHGSAMIAGQHTVSDTTDARRDALSTIGRVEDWLRSMSSTQTQSRDAALRG